MGRGHLFAPVPKLNFMLNALALGSAKVSEVGIGQVRDFVRDENQA